jgi:hypothetical protein
MGAHFPNDRRLWDGRAVIRHRSCPAGTMGLVGFPHIVFDLGYDLPYW